MPLDCLVLDFDGTFTDVEKEAVPFLSAYRDDLARRLGDHVLAAWDEAAAHIGEAPDRFGWELDGRIVAPSHADPYVMATATAQKLLDDHGLLLDSSERRTFLEDVFRANYPHASNVFRPEAREVVEALVDLGLPLLVVTNSVTEAVEAKLDALGPRGRERLRVFGNARKYVLCEPEVPDAAFDAIPESRAVDGLERPIYLRRGAYFDVLREVERLTGASPERTLVCGDIWELDLAMPAELGYPIHLVARPGTPSYERGVVAALPKGAVSESLYAVVDRVGAAKRQGLG